MDDLSINNENKIIEKIKEGLRSSLSKAFFWIDTDEGRIISRAIASLGSLGVGDPTGLVFPLILESADYSVRKRFVNHFPDLIERLQKERQNLNEEFFKSEEGKQILRQALKELIQQTNDEKIEYIKKFILNAFTKTDLEHERITEYLSILSDLQPIQLQILRILLLPDGIVDKIVEKLQAKVGGDIYFSLKDNLREFLGLDEELFERSIQKLESAGLISTEGKEAKWTSGSYYKTHIHEMKDAMNRGANQLVTPFGKAFIKFLIREL